MDYMFEDLIAGREEEFPILAQAIENLEPARCPKIEWVVWETESGSLLRWSNYCQIIRVPYQGDDHEKFKTEFLAAIEKVLIYGVPSYDLPPVRRLDGLPDFRIRTCGGYWHYLSRELEDGDKIRLRPLRDVRFDDAAGPNKDCCEWLAEFSLQVTPAVPVAA